jgi:hypothetical protein
MDDLLICKIERFLDKSPLLRDPSDPNPPWAYCRMDAVDSSAKALFEMYDERLYEERDPVRLLSSPLSTDEEDPSES